MKLWVDYTNWRGKREWRCIVPTGLPIELRCIPDEYDNRDLGKPRKLITTYALDVAMVDRDMARRVLRLDHIHGFYVGEHPTRNAPIDGELRGERDPLCICPGNGDRGAIGAHLTTCPRSPSYDK